MNWLHLQNIGAWVLRTSIETSLIALLVLAAQFILRKRVSARWRYNLWLLVVLRLVLPAFPQSRWSPFNWMAAGGGASTASIQSMQAKRINAPARPLPMPQARPMRNIEPESPHQVASASTEQETDSLQRIVQQPRSQ